MENNPVLQKKEAEFFHLQQDAITPHHTYEEELLFYDLVKAGDPASLDQLEYLRRNHAARQFSGNPLRNEQYLFAIIAALLARSCMESGMPQDEAYRLSDIYIQQADLCATAQEVARLASEMAGEYTHRMQQRRRASYSRIVQRCIDYIHAHLYTHIAVQELSAHIGRSPAYLSTRFKRETGASLTDYICGKRIEISRFLLLHTEYTSQEIGDCLLFSSNSYFIKVFKKQTGCTPKQYREKHRYAHDAFSLTPPQSSAPEDNASPTSFENASIARASFAGRNTPGPRYRE